MAPPLDRARVLDDPHLAGARFCRAYSDLVDAWLAELYEEEVGPVEGVALLAVGGYGRAELAPHSDIDLLLVHRGGAEVAGVAEQVWYPIWDAGLKLGHAVRTPKEALALVGEDLDTATAMLSARVLAGDRALGEEVAVGARAAWQKRSKRWLGELARTVRERHAAQGEVAFLLEPDLKEGRGGLRDVQALGWAEAARPVLNNGDAGRLAEAHDVLLGVRVALHRLRDRPGDRLVLEEQDAVADALGYAHPDLLMGAVAEAARTIAWTGDEIWERLDEPGRGPFGRRAAKDRDLGQGVLLRQGAVALADEQDPATDVHTALRVAVAAATQGCRVERRTLELLAERQPGLPDPWTPELRALFVELLATGEDAVAVIEALDQVGVWVKVLPEWYAVRNRPQRNAYHTFTVDRHLLETAVNAAGLVHRVDRPDLLVVGALLHDIGKGYPGDHTEVGIGIVDTMATRMGFPPGDVAVLQDMVRHHLLLPDVAVRRDLGDDGTLQFVAGAVGSVGTLRLLDALTEADSKATGPAAWNDWKAELVALLVSRTTHVLEGGDVAEVVSAPFPDEAQRARMAAGERIVEASDDRLRVIDADRAGMFSRVAGALALHGLDVLDAAAGSDGRGMAIEEFRVESAFGPVIAWDRVVPDVERALDGRLALQARLDERARTYAGRQVTRVEPATPSVLVDNEISAVATVIEVRAPDAIGLLYRITRAIAELDLDLQSAKIQTLGPDVVDSFYVAHRDGGKVTDETYLAELERAVLHAVTP